LAGYAEWWAERRLASPPSGFLEQLNPVIRPAVMEELGLIDAPWPWQLADPLTLDAYLASALADGSGTAPAPEPEDEQTADPDPVEAGVGPNPPMRLTVIVTDGENLLGGACVSIGSLRSPYRACDAHSRDLDPRPGRIATALTVRGELMLSETFPPDGHLVSPQTVSVVVGEDDIEVIIRHDDEGVSEVGRSG
jgi:hypothetical protein